MAFDITPYVDKTPAEVRALCRDGVIDFPTAGMCRGYAQANLVILPPEYAADFVVRFLKSSKERPTHTLWAKAVISALIFQDTVSTKTAYLQKN